MTAWLTTADAAARVQRPVKFIRQALAEGELHGHQRHDRRGHAVGKSQWRISEAAVDAFVQGADEPAQARACGCPRLRTVGRSA